jgi:hypothetical protein
MTDRMTSGRVAGRERGHALEDSHGITGVSGAPRRVSVGTNADPHEIRGLAPQSSSMVRTFPTPPRHYSDTGGQILMFWLFPPLCAGGVVAIVRKSTSIPESLPLRRPQTGMPIGAASSPT